jgi:hypothetical protein
MKIPINSAITCANKPKNKFLVGAPIVLNPPTKAADL